MHEWSEKSLRRNEFAIPYFPCWHMSLYLYDVPNSRVPYFFYIVLPWLFVSFPRTFLLEQQITFESTCNHVKECT